MKRIIRTLIQQLASRPANLGFLGSDHPDLVPDETVVSLAATLFGELSRLVRGEETFAVKPILPNGVSGTFIFWRTNDGHLSGYFRLLHVQDSSGKTGVTVPSHSNRSS